MQDPSEDDAPLELDLEKVKRPRAAQPDPPIIRGVPEQAPPRRPPPAAGAPARSTALPLPTTGAARAGFSADFTGSLLAPFRGVGALWLPLLVVLPVVGSFLGGRLGLMLMLSFLGAIATYFARSVARGLDQESAAPSLRWPSNFKAEILWPGAATLGLGLLLWGAPLYLFVTSALASLIPPEEPTQAAAQAAAQEDVHSDSWSPGEMFKDDQGKLVVVRALDQPRILQRADGRWVKLYPVQTEGVGEEAVGYLEYLPTSYRPGTPDPTLGREEPPVEDPPPMAEEDLWRQAAGEVWRQVNIPRGRLALILLLACFALYYWPMALTVAALGGSPILALNPVKVLGHAVAGRAEYAAVVLIAPACLAPGLLLLRLPASLLVALGLLVLAYVAGAQGHLMGRLLAGAPERFPTLAP